MGRVGEVCFFCLGLSSACHLSELGRQSSLALFYQGLKGQGTIMKELGPFHHVSAAALLFKTNKQTRDSGRCLPPLAVGF